MILMATFVPSIDSSAFDLSQECMKAFISLGDMLGLYYLFQAKRTSYMAALIGLSWATTESLLRRLIPLCIEARSMQFSWRHTLTAVEANISIVTHISFAVLIWAWNRKPALWREIATLLVGQKFVFPIVTRSDDGVLTTALKNSVVPLILASNLLYLPLPVLPPLPPFPFLHSLSPLPPSLPPSA
jgi:hypothetical protein